MASWSAPMYMNCQPHWPVCWVTSALTAAWVHSWLAFSMPSVITATMTVPGRRSSGSAASRAPASLMVRPIASSSAVLPRG